MLIIREKIYKPGVWGKWFPSRRKVRLTNAELALKLGTSVDDFEYKMNHPRYFNTKERKILSEITGVPFVEMMIGEMSVIISDGDHFGQN
jgi:hypothetical protein